MTVATFLIVTGTDLVHVPGRGRNGRFTRTLESQERDAQACRMRAAGHSFAEIGLHLGYGSAAHAHRAIKRVMTETIAEPADDLRRTELDRLDRELVKLDALERRVAGVLDAAHVTVSNGRVMYLDGQPLPDDAPLLSAVDRLVKITESRTRISESRRKLLGLDAPTKLMSETVAYSIEGVDLSLLR